jgi:hypothetical protein
VNSVKIKVRLCKEYFGKDLVWKYSTFTKFYHLFFFIFAPGLNSYHLSFQCHFLTATTFKNVNMIYRYK